MHLAAAHPHPVVADVEAGADAEEADTVAAMADTVAVDPSLSQNSKAN